MNRRIFQRDGVSCTHYSSIPSFHHSNCERSELSSDEFDPAIREKKVISVHKTREAAEKALKERQKKLGRKVWEWHTRIVWVRNQVRKGDTITLKSFDTWAPGEKIPTGDQVPDGD